MPEKVSTSANGNVEILWDVEIDEKVRHSRLDITIKEKDARKWSFVNVTVPQDHRVMKENEKVDKYLVLAEKAQTEHHVKVKIIPIVIGAMVTIPKRHKNYFCTLGILCIIGGVQASILIGTGRILRIVLSL